MTACLWPPVQPLGLARGGIVLLPCLREIGHAPPCLHEATLREGSDVGPLEARDPALMAGLVGLVEPTPTNPRGIPIAPCRAAGLVGHACAPNLAAHCAACGDVAVLCSATRSEVAALRAGTWGCRACLRAVPT